MILAIFKWQVTQADHGCKKLPHTYIITAIVQNYHDRGLLMGSKNPRFLAVFPIKPLKHLSFTNLYQIMSFTKYIKIHEYDMKTHIKILSNMSFANLSATWLTFLRMIPSNVAVMRMNFMNSLDNICMNIQVHTKTLFSCSHSFAYF